MKCGSHNIFFNSTQALMLYEFYSLSQNKHVITKGKKRKERTECTRSIQLNKSIWSTLRFYSSSNFSNFTAHPQMHATFNSAFFSV